MPCRSEMPDLPLTVIHEDTVNIGGTVFKDNLTLQEIVIPAKILNIRDGAFNGCTNLTTVYNLSSLNIQQGATDNGKVAYYATAVYTSLDEKQTGE